jgi:hypothetical protein
MTSASQSERRRRQDDARMACRWNAADQAERAPMSARQSEAGRRGASFLKKFGSEGACVMAHGPDRVVFRNNRSDWLRSIDRGRDLDVAELS